MANLSVKTEVRKFQLAQKETNGFKLLKEKLCKAPILSYTQSEGKFAVDTDTSNTGIGGAFHRFRMDKSKLLAIFAEAFLEERNYCVTHCELLAVVKALKYFCKFLYRRQYSLFMLTTQH